MLVATYRVIIERHQVGEIPVFLYRDADAPDDAPLVPVLHGLTSRKERHLDLCLRLAGAGFRACALDARYHGDRRTEELSILSGDRTAPDFLATFARTVAGTIQDIATLADYFGAAAYGIIGHSMGGYIALQAALADPRIAALVCISGVLDVTLVPDHARTPDAAPFLSQADVHARAAELGDRPVLLLHGEADVVVPVHGARRLRDLLPSVSFVEYPGIGHEFLTAMAEASVDFLRQHLGAS
jgi:uncharacterized protein